MPQETLTIDPPVTDDTSEFRWEEFTEELPQEDAKRTPTSACKFF
jgi:hypothetical protein